MLPMVHIAGLVIGLLNPLAQGATVVILPKFEPLEFLQAVQKYRVFLQQYTSILPNAHVLALAKKKTKHKCTCTLRPVCFQNAGYIFSPCSTYRKLLSQWPDGRSVWLFESKGSIQRGLDVRQRIDRENGPKAQAGWNKTRYMSLPLTTELTHVHFLIILWSVYFSSGYGMSETSPVVMTDPPNNKQYGSIGQPIPATTTKVPV